MTVVPIIPATPPASKFAQKGGFFEGEGGGAMGVMWSCGSRGNGGWGWKKC